MTSLPRAPKSKRTVGTPGRLIAVVAVLLALPVASAVGVVGRDGWERSTRVLAVFVTLLVLFRVMGKRELGRLSPFELVMLMLIPEVLSNAVQGQGSLLSALAALSTLLLLVLVTSVLAHRFERFEKVVESPPTILVADGHLVEDALNRERIVPDELFAEMHKQGLARLSEVRFAVLEGGGNITFVPAHPPAPTTSDNSKQP